MENKVIKKENNTNANYLVEQLSIQQLIDLTIDSHEDEYVGLESRKELIKRGKDNIQTRIMIKKSIKEVIASLENLLKKIAIESNNKEVVKSFKNKFLNSISVLDKLELEWQKYDLGIKK